MSALYSQVVTASLTIFGMLLGIGNLIFPVRLGVESGGRVLTGFLGFSLTAVLLPVMGLMAIVAFNGDYNGYFARLGRIPGKIFIFICMLIIGPVIVMPRTIALAYALIAPIMPGMPNFLFSVLFVAVVFLLAYRPDKLIDFIGKIMSPIKVFSLLLIIVLGLWQMPAMPQMLPKIGPFFVHAVIDGFQTLDLIAALFFGSIIVRLLTLYAGEMSAADIKRALKITAIAGLCAGVMIGLIYVGMIYLGALYSEGLCGVYEGEAFRRVILAVSGSYGALVLGLVTLVVGLSYVVSVTTVLGDYIHTATNKRVSYLYAILLVLAISVLVTLMELSNILIYSKPFINFFYPLIIVTTVCNLLYKWLGFTWIKLPVAITALISAWLVFW